MTRFVVIETLRRGKVMPPEPLDKIGQIMAERALRAEVDAQVYEDWEKRRTAHIQEERDHKLRVEEVFMTKKPKRERVYVSFGAKKISREDRIASKIKNAYGMGGAF
jgi:hypothetical protein